MSTVGNLFSFPVHSIPESGDSLVLPWARVGIEIEAENFDASTVGPLTASGLWRHKEDGSLRNRGREFVTTGDGLVGKQIIRAVETFCSWARGVNLDEGYPRAGIHIHLDCTDIDLSRGELSNLVGVYLMVEHMLYSYAGDWRKYCGFCDPLDFNQQTLELLRRISFAEMRRNLNAIPGLVAPIHRYSGLNLQALRQYGTIEFRHLPTTFDPEVILRWVNMILSIRRAVTAWDSASDMLRAFHKHSAYDLCASVFGPMWNAGLSSLFREKDAIAGINTFRRLSSSSKAGKSTWQCNTGKPNALLLNKWKPAKKVQQQEEVLPTMPMPAPPRLNGRQGEVDAALLRQNFVDAMTTAARAQQRVALAEDVQVDLPLERGHILE